MDAVERFVTNLFAAFSKPPRRETSVFYADRLRRWDLTEQQWAHACSLIVSEYDKFPTISQVQPYLWRVQRGTRDELVPVWKTWNDSQGRPYAAHTGRRQSLMPGAHEIEQWKREACPTEEGRVIFERAFERAYEAAGGSGNVGDIVQGFGPTHDRKRRVMMSHAGKQLALESLPHEPPESDYDDREPPPF